MIALDEGALICDFAETYQIYNYKALPVSLAATLAVGLRDDSRIKLKRNGQLVSNTDVLLSVVADRLGVVCSWITGEDVTEHFTDYVYVDKPEIKPKDREVDKFNSIAEYEAWHNKVTNGGT